MNDSLIIFQQSVVTVQRTAPSLWLSGQRHILQEETTVIHTVKEDKRAKGVEEETVNTDLPSLVCSFDEHHGDTSLDPHSLQNYHRGNPTLREGLEKTNPH